MFQVRIHGRGGQGVVTAAELLSVASFLEGAHAQAFPSFGSERTGAPVVSYCRIDRMPIRTREPIVAADAVLVQDPTLLPNHDVLSGLADDAYVVINTSRAVADLGINDRIAGLRAERVVTVPATDIAREHIGKPLPNAALLAGFAALTGAVGLDAIERAIRDRFRDRVADANVAGARAAFADVRAHQSIELSDVAAD